MKIALTGASGFIGKHVRNVLSKTDHLVCLICRRANKIGDYSPRESVMEVDIAETKSNWFEYIGEPDVLIHLAWGGLPNYSDQFHLETELPIQTYFLSDLVKFGLKNLIVAGSGFEYGDVSGSLSESNIPNPSSPYGIAKDILRKNLSELQKIYDFKLTWARIFHAYGDGQSRFSLLSQLEAAVELRQEIFVIQDCSRMLDFTPVEEVSEVLVRISELNKEIGVINVGTGFPTSIFDLVNNHIRENGWKIKVQCLPYNEGNKKSNSYWANTQKLKKLLGETNQNSFIG